MQIRSRLSSVIAEIFTCIYLITSVIPGFYLIGSLFLQITVTVVYTMIFMFFAEKFKIKPSTLSHALIATIIFWTLTAIILQVKIHISLNDASLYWYHIFYYDKIALIFVTIATVWIYYIIKILIKSEDNNFLTGYKSFFKGTSISVLIFYVITLAYCFVICRSPGADRQEPNLIPFAVIRNTFMIGRIDYELIFLFLGNIAIFAPLGIFLDAVLNNRFKWILIITPIILSTGIELLQYFLKLGQGDVDDIILNVIGFYIGILLKKLLDRAVKKISKGKINSVFVF